MTKVKIRRRKKPVENKEVAKIKPSNKVLVIVLGEGKNADLLWINAHREMFSFNSNTYFLQDDGIFLTNDRIRVTVFFEGISTPLSQKYIARETVKRVIKLEGKKEKIIPVAIIKGLKYDSKIIDVLLNRGLAQIFTKIREDKIIYLIFFMSLIGIAIGIISIIVSYYYGGGSV